MSTAYSLLQAIDVNVVDKLEATRYKVIFEKLKVIDTPYEEGQVFLPAAFDAGVSAKIGNLATHPQLLADNEMRKNTSILHDYDTDSVMASRSSTVAFSPLTLDSPGAVSLVRPTKEDKYQERYSRAQTYLGFQQAPLHDAHMRPSTKAVTLFPEWMEGGHPPQLPSYDSVVSAGCYIQASGPTNVKCSTLFHGKIALLALGYAYAHKAPPGITHADPIEDRRVIVDDKGTTELVCLSAAVVERALDWPS